VILFWVLNPNTFAKEPRMALKLIATLVGSLLEIPVRLMPSVIAYLLALMVEAPKHTLSHAAKVSGGSKARFSRLLRNHGALAHEGLICISRRVVRRLAKKRRLVMKGSPWTVAIMIDATLTPRSSLHVHNCQRFNHGQGFVIGHQWTNIVIYVGGRIVPLPPIAFLTKVECRARGEKYLTEHERIIGYLEGLELAHWLGPYSPDDVVVMTDSGYDAKKLAQFVLSKGWAWLSALRSTRSAKTVVDAGLAKTKWRSIDALFRAMKRPAPWKTVRLETDRKGRRKEFRARKLIGRIKGVRQDLALVCSEKSNRKGRRYFACSIPQLDTGVIIRTYQLRWKIELFHRAVKQQTGMLDAGLVSFDAVVAHVAWSYCAYILLDEIELPGTKSLLEKQRALRNLADGEPWVAKIRAVAAARTQYGGVERSKVLVAAALQAGMAS